MDLRGWANAKNHIHAAYQIEGREVYNNMQANSLPLHTFHLWDGVKGSLFVFSESSHVAYQINERNYSALIQTHHWCGSKGQNIFFSENGYVAYKLKGEEVQNNMQNKCLNLSTPLTSCFG